MATDAFWIARTCIICEAKKTRQKNEYRQPVCADCEHAHLARDKNTPRLCPADGTKLEIGVFPGNVTYYADHCPECGGFWLTPYELKSYTDYIRDQRYEPPASNKRYGSDSVSAGGD